MRKKRLFEAVSTLVGCVIGAGILGIPYVVAKAGFVTGLVNIVESISGSISGICCAATVSCLINSV